MSTIIKFDLKELKKLANDSKSCVIEKKVTQNLALQPWCLGNLKESVKNLLDYKVGKFDKEFNGILLSYKNLRILQNIGSIRNDNADIHFQVQADYFIFRPRIGAAMKGVVNKKSPTHLGILVHRVFNVVIPRPTEEPGNKWIGASVEEGQQVGFRIVVLDLYGSLPYIRGELDERCVKLGPDGDDEIEESNQAVNVTYVNFDKTKPHVHKQLDDGSPNSSKLSKSHGKQNAHVTKIRSVAPESRVQSDIVPKQQKCKKIESDISVVEKIKHRRQSKVTDGEQNNSEVILPRQSKKQKKDS